MTGNRKGVNAEALHAVGRTAEKRGGGVEETLGAANPRAARIRVVGTCVRMRGTGVRAVGTTVHADCAGARETWTGVRVNWPRVRDDGALIRRTRAPARMVRTDAETIHMPERRIPRPDANFAAYANHYYEAVKKFYKTQGLDPDLLTPLMKALEAWNAVYPAHVAARNAAEAARASKDAAKRELERQIRPVSSFVQSYPATTDADRATIGISVRITGGTPVPPPTSRPVLLVEAGSRLTHRLRIADAGDAGDGTLAAPRVKRPRGAHGAEVYLALVNPHEPPPQDMERYTFVRTVTGGSAEVTFKAPQGGQQAAYLVRWVSATGEPGPWGEMVTATVAA